MNPILVNVLAFLAVFFLIFAGNAVILDLTEDERKRLKRRLEEELRERQRMRAKDSAAGRDFSQIAADARAQVERPRQSILQRLTDFIDQSGLDLPLPRLLAIALAGGAILGAAAGFGLRSFVLGVMFAIAGSLLPLLYVHYRRKVRLGKLCAQLPDAFELMSRVLRSGQTISQAMQSVAEEFSPPIALEFLYCHEQMNLGLSTDAALRDLAKRTALLEVKIFVLAVLVHRQTGGNLAELLDKLSEVVRDRFRIQGMIQSLTAQGRLQAGILLSLPPFMFAVLMLISPDYEMILLQYPIWIAVGLGMMFLGALWIRKIINFDF